MVADNAGSSGALTVFEQAIWDSAGRTWLDFSQDGDRNGIYHRASVHGQVPIAVNGATLSNNKYCLNIDEMDANNPALFVNILGGPINSPDKYGSYITQNLGTVNTYHRGCAFDGGFFPSSDYDNYNTDGFEFSSGGNTFLWAYDCEMKNFSDGAVDAHGGCTAYIDACRLYRSNKLLRLWGNTVIVIANTVIDTSLDGDVLCWFDDLTGQLVSYNNTWIADGTIYDSIEDVPTAFFMRGGTHGLGKEQATETQTDPFASDEFFIQARVLSGDPPVDPPDPPSQYPLLSLSPGNWTGDPTNHLYFWERDTVPIPGEEASSFQTTIADDGFNIGGGVVAENAFGESLPEDSSNTVFVQVVVLNATMGVEQESFNPATYGYKGPGSSEALLGTIDNDVLYGETATDIYTNSGNDFVVIKLDGGASFGSDYSIKFQIDSEPEVTIDWDSQYSEYSDPLTSLSDYIVSKVGQDVAVKITVLEP